MNQDLYIPFIINFFIILAVSTACRRVESDAYKADFNLIDRDHISNISGAPGVSVGTVRISRKPVEAGGASWRVSNGKLVLEFDRRGYFSITPEIIGLPGSWKLMESMILKVKTDSSSLLVLEVYGPQSRIRDTLHLGKGRSRHKVDIREAPLLGGIQVKPDRIRITSETPSKVILEGIRLVEGEKQPVLVDRWGQRALADWRGKIRSERQFLDLHEEGIFLDSLFSSITYKPVDQYGGYTNRNIMFKATGYFRIEYQRGRWWLVTPDGHPFFSMGVNGVGIKSFGRNEDITRIQGRREIFEQLPRYHECPLCFREDSGYFSFYCWNVMRKYPSLEKWKEQTEKRLTAAGFNTIGNWSDTLYCLYPEMPYCYSLDSRRNPDLMMSNHLPDVFHPEWKKHLIKEFSRITRFSHDPYLLGYLVDNDIQWRSIMHPDTASHTYRELKDLDTDRQRSAVYAETYFSTIRTAIRKYDPNHLYLGCGFNWSFKNMESIAMVAGKYVDVLTVNIYSPYPYWEQMDLWYSTVKQPMLIGEYHIPSRTKKQLWPRYPSFQPDKRDRMIENYILAWASYPFAIGSHWYQYRDQEVAGRGDGGENQPVGLVTVADQPDYRLLMTYHRIANKLPDIIGLSSDHPRIYVQEIKKDNPLKDKPYQP